MRKIIFFVVSFYSLMLLLVACGNGEEVLYEQPRFSIRSDIQGVTRTPVLDGDGRGYFIEGDVNTVFFQDRNGKLLKEISYTYGNTYYWSDFQLENATDGLLVSACYPPVKADRPTDFSWDVTSSNLAIADFLAASPVEVIQGVTTDVVLKFNHLMHKIVVKLKADGTTVTEEDLSKAKISIYNFRPTAVIDLLSAEVKGASGTMARLESTGVESAFILPPQTVGTIEVKVELEDRSQTFRLSECKVNSSFLTQLQSGKFFTLVISVSRGSFTITGQDIDPWGSQGEANGNIII